MASKAELDSCFFWSEYFLTWQWRRFWLVDVVLVFLQLFLGDFFLFFYIKPQNSFFSDGVKDGWSLSLPFGTSEIIHHRSVEVRSWKLSCNTQKVKT